MSEHSAYVVVLGAVVVVEVELSFASFKQEVSLLGPTVIYEGETRCELIRGLETDGKTDLLRPCLFISGIYKRQNDFCSSLDVGHPFNSSLGEVANFDAEILQKFNMTAWGKMMG